MADIEQRALSLLVAAYICAGKVSMARDIRLQRLTHRDKIALQAIVAALASQPQEPDPAITAQWDSGALGRSDEHAVVADEQPQARTAAVPEGMKLVPTEPTPEIIAAAAVAAWPTASPSDVAMARVAARTVLMGMDTAPGVTIDVLAGILATMAPAYRAMVAASPATEVGA